MYIEFLLWFPENRFKIVCIPLSTVHLDGYTSYSHLNIDFFPQLCRDADATRIDIYAGKTDTSLPSHAQFPEEFTVVPKNKWVGDN